MERKRLEKEAVTPPPQARRATWMPAGASPPATGSDVLKRYGLALLLAGLALSVRALLPFPQGASVYQLPIAAVVLSAWYGGRGPGLLASVVCATGSLYLFLPPQYSLELSPDHRIPFSIFIGLCLLLSEFGAGRKRVEGQLRARHEMLDLAQTAARAVAFDWFIGARETENRWSPELEAIYGLEPGTFDRTFEGWKKLIHPDDWPAVKLALKRAHESGDVAAEYRVLYQDGTTHWLRAKGRMFLDAAGRPQRMVGFMTDITDWRHAQQELRASEERFRTFVDRATDAFFLLNERLEVVDVNRQACESMGWSREELIGMQPRQFDVSLDQSSIERLSQRAIAGEIITFETRHRRKDGSAFPVEIRTGTFKEGGKLFYLSIARDISERKLAEETLLAKEGALETTRAELARVSRLTTLGELTASIAHEVGQPIGAMVASAGACTRWLGADPPAMAEAHAALGNIVADGKRAREVIARIRALAQRQGPRKELLDINQEIVAVLALTEHELRSHDIVLRTDLLRTLPRTVGDRIQLQQVMLNLIVNAVEAMSAVHDRARELAVVSRLEDPDAVVVELRDSGSGLDPQAAAQVFEPFYTTKTDGIGIGLSISRSIIEAHGGRLWVSANSPQGAVFQFSLPVAAEVVS